MKRQLLLTLLAALLFSLSFPPFRFGFLAYGALVPILFLLNECNFREAFRWGYLWGLFVSIGILYWIFLPTPAGAVVTILIHPLYFALFALTYYLVRSSWGDWAVFAAPFLWTAIEYLKSLGELGFPWVSIGYTQSYYQTLIQYASYTSVFGVSFWVVLMNVCVYMVIRRRDSIRAIILYTLLFLVLLMLPYFYGKMVIPRDSTSARKLRVGIVQGNIDPYLKWDKNMLEMNFNAYEQLTRKIPRDSTDLIIWPETATPTYLLHDPRNLWRVQRLVAEMDTPILTGTPDYIRLAKNRYKTFNSVVLLDGSDGPYQKYAKIQLVPFGERVPYEDDIPILKSLLAKLEMGEGNFSPGNRIAIFKLAVGDSSSVTALDTVKLGTVICFESIFPNLVRKFVLKQAELLVVVTNDGWFGRTGAPYQHAQMAVFRAIENRISVARCANTGVSMTIDPWGRVRKRSAIFTEAVFTDELPLRKEFTFFTTHGNVFANAVTGIAMLLIVASVVLTKFL